MGQRGLTLYSRNTRHTTQGLVVQRADRADTRLNLRWAHYPLLQPGETWESGEYVLLPHAGDWYAGARAYKRFTERGVSLQRAGADSGDAGGPLDVARPAQRPAHDPLRPSFPSTPKSLPIPSLGIAELDRVALVVPERLPDRGRSPVRDGGGLRGRARALRGDRGAGGALRQPPHPARHRRNGSRLGASQRRQPGGDQQLDLRPRFPADVPAAVQRHARDGQRLRPLARVAKDRARGLRAFPRARRQGHLLRCRPRVGRTQLQSGDRRPARRGRRKVARVRARARDADSRREAGRQLFGRARQRRQRAGARTTRGSGSTGRTLPMPRRSATSSPSSGSTPTSTSTHGAPCTRSWKVR